MAGSRRSPITCRCRLHAPDRVVAVITCYPYLYLLYPWAAGHSPCTFDVHAHSRCRGFPRPRARGFCWTSVLPSLPPSAWLLSQGLPVPLAPSLVSSHALLLPYLPASGFSLSPDCTLLVVSFPPCGCHPRPRPRPFFGFCSCPTPSPTAILHFGCVLALLPLVTSRLHTLPTRPPLPDPPVGSFLPFP